MTILVYSGFRVRQLYHCLSYYLWKNACHLIPHNASIVRKLCSSNSKMGLNIKTFVFIDSETTGLPYYESNRTRMTELCLIAVQSDHIDLGVLPRIQNKITLCFNPGKYIDPQATNITGLSNELLEYQPAFNGKVFGMIQDFLNLQSKPICFVAHNGNYFDYPILQAEIHRNGNQLPEDILCIDSLEAFKQFHEEDTKQTEECNTEMAHNSNKEIPYELQDGYDELLFRVLQDLKEARNDAIVISSTERKTEISNSCKKRLTIEEIQKINETTPKKHHSNGLPQISTDLSKNASGSTARQLFVEQKPSFKLGNIYTKLTGKEEHNSHRAEIDVNMLIECTSILGERFTKWANANAKRFCDIPMMTPGKKIGT